MIRVLFQKKERSKTLSLHIRFKKRSHPARMRDGIFFCFYARKTSATDTSTQSVEITSKKCINALLVREGLVLTSIGALPTG